MDGDFGWLPGPVRRDIATIRLYNQIVSKPESRIVYKVFQLDRTCNLENSWYRNVENICKCAGFGDDLQTCNVINLDRAKTNLLHIYKREWHDEMETKNKLAIYRQLKTNPGTENYLNANLSRQGRHLISMIRLGVLLLEVECGHFNGVTREEWVCKMCNDGVEDEFHFLFHCAKLIPLRIELFNKLPYVLAEHRDIDKLRILCQKPYVFSNYLKDLWDMRVKINDNS